MNISEANILTMKIVRPSNRIKIETALAANTWDEVAIERAVYFYAADGKILRKISEYNITNINGEWFAETINHNICDWDDAKYLEDRKVGASFENGEWAKIEWVEARDEFSLRAGGSYHYDEDGKMTAGYCYPAYWLVELAKDVIMNYKIDTGMNGDIRTKLIEMALLIAGKQ